MLSRFVIALSLLALAGFLTSGFPASSHAQAPWASGSIDPSRVVKPPRCGGCHEQEFRVWKQTPHALSPSLAKPNAQEIAQRMGTRLDAHDGVCVECHHTPAVNALGGMLGVSCESCHGAARDWLELHHDYGGSKANYHTESPDHRRARIENSKAAGMFRPSGLYDVLQRCYRCHTVPNETLVNRGNHGSGSDIRLPEWFEKIEHNYLQSEREGDGTLARELSPGEKRVMWVAGWALDLEYSYRGIATATAQGLYLRAMERRAREATKRLQDVRSRVDVPEVGAILTIALGSTAAPERRTEFLHLAEQIAVENQRFIAARDGADLTGIDTLLSGWRPVPAELPEVSAGSPAEAPAVGAEPVVAGPEAVGEKLAHVGQLPDRQALGLTACGKCHSHQMDWLDGDPHGRASSRISSASGRRIAQKYGLSVAQAASGAWLCMDCHAGRGAAALEDGVACEACHGPSKDYMEPHQKKGGGDGVERPGYVVSLKLGLADLRRARPLADRCAGCHYINQPRLLAAGHTPGTRFALPAAHSRIKHWEFAGPSDAELTQAYTASREKLGPMPPGVSIMESIASADTMDSTDPTNPGSASPTSEPGTRLQVPPHAGVDEILALIRDHIRILRKSGGAR